MSDVVTTRLSLEEARDLTEEVKADAATLWAKLLNLYEGEAHLALGYGSWGEYYAEEFGGSKSEGYRLLEAGRVVESIPNVGNDLPPIPTVHHAQALAPVLKDEGPERVEEVWGEVVERNGHQPTAAQVREVVTDRTRGQLANQAGGSDEWATPQDFFDTLNAEFNFTLDVCALPWSAKCEQYFTPQDDGLAQNWTGACWMNPPYGNEIGEWVRKAWESGEAGATVVCLVPARVDTGWWWDYCRYGEVRFLRGRLKFGNSDTSAPFPSVVVIFGREPRVEWWEWR